MTKIDELKKQLAKHGYFTVGLWHQADITSSADSMEVTLTPEQTQKVFDIINAGNDVVSWDLIEETISNVIDAPKVYVLPGDFTRIDNDSNGNPRYVCHFLHFIHADDIIDIEEKYTLALSRAKKLGGRKFHNKQYGGGIAFQSYNTADLCRKINDFMNAL